MPDWEQQYKSSKSILVDFKNHKQIFMIYSKVNSNILFRCDLYNLWGKSNYYDISVEYLMFPTIYVGT